MHTCTNNQNGCHYQPTGHDITQASGWDLRTTGGLEKKGRHQQTPGEVSSQMKHTQKTEDCDIETKKERDYSDEGCACLPACRGRFSFFRGSIFCVVDRPRSKPGGRTPTNTRATTTGGRKRERGRRGRGIRGVRLARGG